ncbi:LuxR family transcriptional regulator [Actinoplanes lobatus]|uniref:ATP/maltotriose-dependent transcriptional regulator MalT/type II secretory pathway predicted ATPase ExeA n=1 Tax=Actinoplanes lobatus TaxID=113568 RepID=A0A7W7MJ79_9ACTN|nr:LuxR family transcriptional regulator [Actinoplanes lobatus]MBB4752178.1 ATP/maltotriose-dependent transcriptional regulator MalT/type II secretory pathway predicted ATPase ExeA [Actinoplanes lobatus]GGN83926.1 LuxR family transcriptional regulator [Actinoplanes lobatus]GIE45440.1 LuxR family transcriptional regulator [Actinoplanes lobatus]
MGGVPLIGRDDELAELALAIRDEHRHVLVTGEVGIGKTRLVTQAAQVARDEGAVVVEASCLPLDVRLPLLPVIEVLRSLDRALGREVLAALPLYALDELARLVPEVIGRQAGPDALPAGEWQRQRLFAAVGLVLTHIAGSRPVVVVIEDIHWADAATLDLLTYLRASSGGSITLIATCRSDEAPLDPPVARWVEQARRPETVRLELAGLSRAAIAELAEQTLDSPPPESVVEELHRRTEGNPYFAEELIAAAVVASHGGPGVALTRQPPRVLAELLVARSRRVSDTARAVLAVLAVAGRSVPEIVVARATGMAAADVTCAMHELVDARLATPDSVRPELGCRTRHALLAEAVAGDLLADERRAAHAGIAAAFAATNDPALSAEIAGHWSAAGRPRDEFGSLLEAAEHSHRLHAYTQAADLWHRAADIAESLPDVARTANVEPGWLRIRTIDALQACGRDVDAEALIEQTYATYRDSPSDTLTAAVLHRAAWHRGVAAQRETPSDTAYALFEEARRIHEMLPESPEYARLLADHARCMWTDSSDRNSEPIYRKALAVAERCGATLQTAHALTGLAAIALLHGEPSHGFALFDRARDLAGRHSGPSLHVEAMTATHHSDALLKSGQLAEAERIALEGLDRVRWAGAASRYPGGILRGNAAESLLERGLIDAAARLVADVHDRRPKRDDWNLHLLQAQVEICRGATESAVARARAVDLLGLAGPRMWVYERARFLPKVALWAGDPAAALDRVERALEVLGGCSVELYCGELFALGARAVADLADTARARRDGAAERAALTGAERLAAALDLMGSRPLTDHRFLAAVPGDRADWQAELLRLRGVRDPDAWAEAAAVWQRLGRPHRMAYAWWRQAEALLARSRNPMTASGTLQAAAEAANGMAPLTANIRRLARRSRISIRPVSFEPPPATDDPYGLTQRERQVLRLLAQGCTNAQIGGELFMSPKTASVHVSNILRKLNVVNRAEAAAVGERARLTGPDS